MGIGKGVDVAVGNEEGEELPDTETETVPVDGGERLGELEDVGLIELLWVPDVVTVIEGVTGLEGVATSVGETVVKPVMDDEGLFVTLGERVFAGV